MSTKRVLNSLEPPLDESAGNAINSLSTSKEESMEHLKDSKELEAPEREYSAPTVERKELYEVVRGGGTGSIDGGQQPTGPEDRPR